MIKFLSKSVRFLIQPSAHTIGFSLLSIKTDSLPDISSSALLFSHYPKSFRFSAASPFQLADPFLFEHDNTAYCFYESKNKNTPGRISGIEFRFDGKVLNEFDCDLSSCAHFSFPFVFSDFESGTIYMLPESAALGEVALYKALAFPTHWEKTQVLLNGNYVDSHLFLHRDHYYLFTTEKVEGHHTHKYDYRLHIFSSPDLKGPFNPHPCNPIACGRKSARSGGAILASNGKIYRVAQDCEDSYGRELNLFEIEELSETEYKESLYLSNWIHRVFGNANGGHHLSMLKLKGREFLAVDLNIRESWFQRFLNFMHV